MVSLSFLSLASNAGLPVEWPGHRRTGMARSTLPGLFPESGGRLGGNAHRGSFERPSAEPTLPPVIIYWYVNVRCSRTRVPAPRALVLCRGADRVQAYATKNGLFLVSAEVLANRGKTRTRNVGLGIQL